MEQAHLVLFIVLNLIRESQMVPIRHVQPLVIFLRKGGAFDVKHYQDVWAGFVGVVLYRSAEALLNYMEASYEKNGTLDGTAREYWQILRRRAHVSEDIDATIMATDMAKEAENDWGAYSAGRLLTDKTLYNIS